jgi:hypothetical protein
LLALGACGGGDSVDLTGMYRVDTAVGSMPCGTDEPLATFPAFLKFSKDEFLGQSYFKFDECTDEAGTDCPNTGGLFNGFYESISGGWRGVVTGSLPNDTNCALSYFEQTAMLKNTMLVIESKRLSDSVDLPAAECEPKEAEKRKDSMPCVEHKRFDATQR